MRLLAATLMLLVLLPATAAQARKVAFARTVECDRAERAATFRGEMRAMRRTPGMEMKFLLEVREPGEAWRRVRGVEGFGAWHAADPGRAGFIVDKRVEDLVPGLALRSVVRFRWRDKADRVVARARRVTPACRQPDTRPDLVADWVIATDGSRPDTVRYTVRVFNDGASEAPVFATRVRVNGQDSAPQSTTGPLAPGDEAVLEIEAPRCAPGTTVTATVDVDGAVDESDETDNVVTIPCEAAL